MTVDLAEASDGELAIFALAGRQSAYGEILRRHREPLLRLVRTHIGNDDEAIDVLQDCFVAAFSNLDRFDQTRSMRAWLARIAINKARDWHRRRAVRRFFAFAVPLSSDITETAADDGPAADTVLDGKAALARVLTAIASLPASLKEPLLLGTLEALPQAAIGEVLGISEKAVELRIKRARAKLRELLDAQALGQDGNA